tara:strand:+ start:2509 stop:2709 length:201 start_codon:yes stop_codon:yes gene_type:complete
MIENKIRFDIFNDYKEGDMNIKIEQAKELLRELDRVTDRAFSIKIRKMAALQETLSETREQLGIRV